MALARDGSFGSNILKFYTAPDCASEVFMLKATTAVTPCIEEKEPECKTNDYGVSYTEACSVQERVYYFDKMLRPSDSFEPPSSFYMWASEHDASEEEGRNEDGSPCTPQGRSVASYAIALDFCFSSSFKGSSCMFQSEPLALLCYDAENCEGDGFEIALISLDKPTTALLFGDKCLGFAEATPE